MPVEQAAPVKLMFECAIQTYNLPQVPLAFYHQEWHIGSGKAKIPMQRLLSTVHHRVRLPGLRARGACLDRAYDHERVWRA